uniref:Uncharacterized protein n=1 Tax=Arundo donax TaxID=35708 RepID=A0A0A8ZJH7_ARUDO
MKLLSQVNQKIRDSHPSKVRNVLKQLQVLYSTLACLLKYRSANSHLRR